MDLLRCMPIGLPSTIENLMEYLLVMGFYSTTKVQEGEGLLLQKITRGLSRIHCGLDNCLYLGNIEAKEIGVMQKIM